MTNVPRMPHGTAHQLSDTFMFAAKIETVERENTRGLAHLGDDRAPHKDRQVTW